MRRTSVAALLAALLVIAALSPVAAGSSVREMVRIEGQGESVLQGLGLVVGLPGTGDSAQELAVARPLAEVLRRNGNPIGSIEELGNSRSVALVMVMSVIPEGGAKTDDRFDVTVSVINSASSLQGGTLYIAPLTGPYPGSPVYAVAQGQVDVEDENVPTSGRVRGGARIVREIAMPPIGNTFDLIIHPYFSGWSSATQIAANITDAYLLRPPDPDEAIRPVARVIDERTVRIEVPEIERNDPAAFVADVLSTEIDISQLNLPAQVICNPRTGAIIVTGDVEISMVALTHRNLVIRHVMPEPEPDPLNPLEEEHRWTGIGTSGRETERARLEDLLNAFKQLDVPVEEQIQILQMLHKTGRLHAQLIMD